MALYFRKKTLLAKAESTYGTDPTPTGAANAILTKNLQIQLMQGNTANRDVDRPTLGNDLTYHVAPFTKLSFDVELAGSGTAGVAPAYAPLSKACGFAETAVVAPVTGTAQAGSTSTTLKLAAAASATDDYYCGLTVTTTGGTGSGQTGYITDYVGSTKVATVLTAWGVTPDVTTTYSIGAGVVYAPISDTYPSVTCYFNIDGELHKVTGCRGTVKFALSPASIPMMSFESTGIRNAPSATAAPTCDWTTFRIPVAINNANAPTFKLQGYAATVSKLDLDLANQIVYRNVVGQETVELVDRAPAGSITVDLPPLGTKDYHAAIVANSTGAMHFLVGTASGYIFQVLAPQAQILQPQIAESDGIATLQCALRMIPTDAGNDEFFLTVR